MTEIGAAVHMPADKQPDTSAVIAPGKKTDSTDDYIPADERGDWWSAVRPVITLVAWVHLYLVALLGIWVVMVMLTTGWRPVVITSGSMSPTLRAGDIILVQDHSQELVGQRSVITFKSARGDGELITHRVFETLEGDGLYITKGDANPSPDTDRVSPDQVEGVGRLVVPLLGLPVVWAQQGNLPALLATGVLSMAAIVIAATSTRSSTPKPSTAVTNRASGLANRAIRRVRVLVGLMIVSQFFLDGGRFEIDVIWVSRGQFLLLSVAMLAAINAMSVRVARHYNSTLR